MAEGQETSDYPGALDSWVDLTDKEDLAEVSDINKIKAAIEAVQTELGTDVAGSLTNLVDRLAVMMEDNGAMNQGTSFPGTPVEGQVFYRTDTDTVYIYDGSTWDTMATPAMTVSSVTSFSAATTSGNVTLEADKVYLMTFRLAIDGSTDSAINLDMAGTGESFDYSIDGYELTTGVLDAAATAAANIPLGTVEAATNTKTMVGQLYIYTTASGNNRAMISGTVSLLAAATRPAVINLSARFYSTAAIATLVIGSAQNMTGTVYLYEMGLSV